MGAGSKEEGRRRVGEADPETRRALIRKEMGIKMSDSEKARAPAPARAAPAAESVKAPRSTTSTAVTAGVDKLLKPRANIERGLKSLGE